MRALIRSDLAASAAIEGRVDEALAGWRAALEIDPDCLMARLNRDLIEAELSFGQMSGDVGELKLAPAPVPSPLVGEGGPQGRMGGGVGLGSGSSPCRGDWCAPSPALRAPSPRTGRGWKRGSRVLRAFDRRTTPGHPPFTGKHPARSHGGKRYPGSPGGGDPAGGRCAWRF